MLLLLLLLLFISAASIQLMIVFLSSRNQLISDAAYSFGDELLKMAGEERTVLVKQQPKQVRLAVSMTLQCLLPFTQTNVNVG